jgi:molybdate transport system permease protein
MTSTNSHSDRQGQDGSLAPWPARPDAGGTGQSVRSKLFIAWMILLGSLYLLLVVALLGGNVLYMDWGLFWQNIWTPEIRYATTLSFVTSTITVLLSLVVGVPAGYVLARRRFWGITFIDTILDMPIILPPLVVGLSLLIFFQTAAGRAINSAFPGGLLYQPAGIVLAQFTVACAFGIRTLKTTFEQLDPRIEAVARTLGASQSQAFFRLTLPAARNGILAAAVLTWARAIGEFGPILIFCGTTRLRTEILPTSLYLEFSIGHVQAALAVSMLMVGVSMITLLLVKKLGGMRYI